MKPCENCGNDHDESFETGRFCSKKCKYGFSTKAKRKEINEKVRLKIIGSGHDKITNICVICGNSFTVKWNKRNQTTCSLSCSSKLRWSRKEYQDLMKI